MKLIDIVKQIEPDKSKSEIKRLIKQGAIKIAGEKKIDRNEEFSLDK